MKTFYFVGCPQHFHPAPVKDQAGMIISYRLTPLPYIPVSWITEITHVRKPEFFVDEQRFGPYKFWHHQHLFKAIGGGTEVTDIVHYAMDYGFLGNLMHRLIVSPRLENIFDYRYEKLTRLFSASAPAGEAKNNHDSRPYTATDAGKSGSNDNRGSR